LGFVRKSQAIQAGDVGRLLRLAGEAGEERDVVARRRRIMLGMQSFIGGHSSLFFRSDRFSGVGGFAAPDSLQFEGFDAAGQSRQRAYLVEGQFLDPNAPVMIHLPDRVMTHRRRRLLDDAAWYASDHFQNVRRPSGIDDQLYAKVHLPDGSMIGLGLQRALGDRPFTDRDCRLIDLFHEQLASLYLPRPGDAAVPPPPASPPPVTLDDRLSVLPPRYRPVARRLLVGDSSKQAALALGLTRHTVHEYIKQMHRRLNVSNRGELLALLNPPAA
jgi:DNA-binding CsgD family transcriptional regulator